MIDQVTGNPAVRISRVPLHGRRVTFRNMMPMATIFFVAVGCSGGNPVSAPETPASATPHVVFYAEGTGTEAAAMTLRTESGGVIQKDVSLPLYDTTTGKAGLASDQFKRGDSVYVSFRNKNAAGSVTCRIEVDGKRIDEATSTGAYKFVSCAGKVP